MSQRADSEPGLTTGQQSGVPGAPARDGDAPTAASQARADWERRIGQRRAGAPGTPDC